MLSGIRRLSRRGDGVTISGVMLASPVLNYGVRVPGYDQAFIGLLPTYAAIAHHYGKAGQSISLIEWTRRARLFSQTEYNMRCSKVML